MEFLADHWMPIVLSAVIVFFASFLTHMVLPLHKSEFKKLPDEDATMAGLAGVAPDLYMFPFMSGPEDMKSHDYLAKVQKGPNGMVILWPKPVNMGQNLGLTFLFYLLVGVFCGVYWVALHCRGCAVPGAVPPLWGGGVLCARPWLDVVLHLVSLWPFLAEFRGQRGVCAVNRGYVRLALEVVRDRFRIGDQC